MPRPSSAPSVTSPAPGAGAGPDEVPDLRLVLPALVVWVVAWQSRVLPVPVVLLGSSALAVMGALALLVGAGRPRAGALLSGPRAPGPRRGALVIGCALLLGAAAGVSTAARVHTRTSGPLATLSARSAAAVLEGVVLEDPHRAASAPHRDLLVVVRLRVERVASGGRTEAVRAPVLVLSDQAVWLDLLPSQRVRVEGRLGPAQRGDDVAAVLSGRGPPQVLSRPTPVQRVAGRLRAGLRAAVAPLPAAERGLLPGLVVGDVSRLPDDLQADFRVVGLTHLTAVSGSNVAIVLAAVLLLASRTGLGLRWRPVLAALGLAGFVVLARPSPSVLRAAVMGAVALLALATGGRRQAVPSLSAAVLLLVLVSPDLAASPGFALSVLATAGLLVLAGPWRELLAARLPGWAADALAVPAAAQVACGPVIVAISGTLGLLAVPANLLAAPAVAPATVLGVAAAVLAPVSLPLARLAAWLAYLPVAWLVLVAHVGAGLPYASLPWPDGARGALLLAGLSAALLAALSRRLARRVLLAVTLAVTATVGGLSRAAPGWPPPDWFLVMCDVGQGDALVARAGPHTALVVDAGPDPDAVDGCLRRLGIRTVPLVVLTHLHADHVDGLPGVLRGRDVGGVEVGPADDPPRQAAQVRAQTSSDRVPEVRAALQEVRTLGGLRWSVLGPVRTYRGTRSDPNNDSLVLRLEVAGVVVLLCGDVEPEAQADLLAAGTDLRADVLKVPHHGSRYQDPGFLAAVHPRVALTSVGVDNGYGHPSADTLGALLRAGARSYRTDRDGDTALVRRPGGGLGVVARHGHGTAPP